MQEGIVIKSTGSWYDVRQAAGKVIQCRIVGKFRLQGLKITNPVAVGDLVYFVMEEDGITGLIKEVGDRRNYVVRQSPRQKHYLHLLASNIDQACLVVTVRAPKLKQGFIDRFLLMTEPYNIPVLIIFNKSDLYTDQDLQLFEGLKAIYNDIGYEVLLLSALEGTGMEELKTMLKDKVSLFSGQSGVGKSTVVNGLLGNDQIKTTELSDYTGKGQHTTTFAEMFESDNASKIIDTPGIKTLSFNHLEPMDVAHNFREIFERSTACKFSNCLHRDEPKCAVKKAVEEGEIFELRYMNYLQLLEEMEDQNYWERNKDY